MAEAIVRNKARDFLQEIQKLDPKAKTASNVNGQVERKEIADILLTNLISCTTLFHQ